MATFATVTAMILGLMGVLGTIANSDPAPGRATRMNIGVLIATLSVIFLGVLSLSGGAR